MTWLMGAILRISPYPVSLTSARQTPIHSFIQQESPNQAACGAVAISAENMKSNPRLAYIIAGGKIRYIIEHGVLGWGLLTAFLFAAWTCVSHGGLSKAEFFAPFIIFPFGGIFWGLFMWLFWKREFDKQQLESSNQADQDASSYRDKPFD
jgi:hypothetical protein